MDSETQSASLIIARVLPLSLALIMFGLGLDLTRKDFARVVQIPKPVVVGLFVQMFLLPAVAFLLCRAFALPPELSIGMILLAASPGGVSANIYSHLCRGDVALNLTLTAVNSVLAAATLPLLVNAAIRVFAEGDQSIGLQFSKTVEVFMIVLVPVALGMLFRAKFPTRAQKLDRPFRVFSVVILALLIVGTAAKGRNDLMTYGREIGLAVLIFNLVSLGAGYGLPLLLKLPRKQAIAIGFEIGIHNGVLAMTIAFTLLENPMIAMPAAVYSVIMFVTAAAFAFWIRRRGSEEGVVTSTSPAA